MVINSKGTVADQEYLRACGVKESSEETSSDRLAWGGGDLILTLTKEILRACSLLNRE